MLVCKLFEAFKCLMKWHVSNRRTAQQIPPAMRTSRRVVCLHTQQSICPTGKGSVAGGIPGTIACGRGKIKVAHGIQRLQHSRDDAMHLRSIQCIEHLTIYPFRDGKVTPKRFPDCCDFRDRKFLGGKAGCSLIFFKVFFVSAKSYHILSAATL